MRWKGFSAASIVAPVGGAGGPMVVATGTLTGSRGNAVSGSARHDGFWSSTAISPAQRKQLLSQTLGVFYKTVPPGVEMLTAVPLVGKPIIVEQTHVSTDVLDLQRDGKSEVFFNVIADLKTPLDPTPFAVGSMSLLAAYEPATDSWKKILACRLIGQEVIRNDKSCSLIDVMDINGDGVAEVIVGRGSDESGDIEIYEVSGGKLRLVAAIIGWTGS